MGDQKIEFGIFFLVFALRKVGFLDCYSFLLFLIHKKIKMKLCQWRVLFIGHKFLLSEKMSSFFDSILLGNSGFN